jgi:DtxR family Mn-dependent transcriptional regulator
MVNREQDGTSALDRYLLIIGETLEKGERPRVRDIAKRLEVSKPAVTAALRGLGQKGLVMYQPYAPITLTESGQERMQMVLEQQKSLVTFFSVGLGLSEKESKEEALQVGLHVSEKLFKRMIAYIDFLEDCPAKKISWEKDLAGICEDPD